MFTLLTALLLVSQPFLVHADNDWTTACTGSCSYESGDGVKKAWGTILIDGSSEAVSDISTAAGWSIMECNPDSQEAQQVRLVCHDPGSGCEQLFEGGAVNTIVRLPDDCADAPFARVVNVTSSTNQTLSSKVANRIAHAKVKRSTPPEVMTIEFDYNFHLIPASRGTVSLTALATTNPLQRPIVNAQRVRRALGYSEDGRLNARSSMSAGELVSRELRRRDLFAEFVNGNVIPSGVTSTLLKGTDGPSSKEISSKNGNDTISNKLGDWTKDWNKQFNILDISESFPVADAKLSCPQNGDVPAFDAKIKIDAEVDVKATVSVGFILAGTILPPAINKAAFTSALDGSAAANFKISAVAQGSFNTGLIPLYSSGLAGLSIPGIIDIGPSFSINGQGLGKLGVSTEAVVKADYKFPGLTMVFPQDQGTSNGQASQDQQNPLSLSIGGSAELFGTVEAHLIPRVDLGVKVLSGAASASVFLQLDGYGALDMNLKLQGTASTGPTTENGNKPISSSADDLVSTSTIVSTVESSSSATPTSTSEESASASSSEAKSLPIAIVDTASSDTLSTASSTLDAPIPEETPAPATGSGDDAEPDVKEADSYDGEDDTTDVDSNSSSTPAPAPAPVALDTIPSSPSSGACPTRRRHSRRSHKQRRDIVINAPRDASGTYSGCVGVDMGVKIVAGAQGKLLSFWHDSVTFDLFSQKWDVFEKCFQGNLKRGDTPIRRGSFVPALQSPPSSLIKARQLDGLICPAISDALSANNQIV